MKGTKRIIMLLLVVSLVMGLMLTACGQTPQEEEPAETPSEETPSETPEDTEPDNEAAQSDLRFGYICKMLTIHGLSRKNGASNKNAKNWA